MSVTTAVSLRNQLTPTPRAGGTFILHELCGFLARGLFLAEAIQPHAFGALARLCRRFRVWGGRGGNRHGRGRGDCRKVCRRCLSRGIGWLELQAELHRRVEEALDGIERNHETLGDAAEREADFETVVGHHQVPELVLPDDG